MRRYKSLFVLLICFFGVLHAQTPQELRSWLPAVPGWTISDKVEVFTPDNLFNRINGSAPLFLENNFREMTALEYTRGDDYITIQVYRHATPDDTFGMYASERSSELNFYPIGGEAQGDDTNIYFFADNVYVKMWSSASDNVGDVMRTIAEDYAKKIDPQAGYPAILQAFPANGKTPYSETYITSSYLGHEFLKSVFTTNYSKDGQSFQAFVIDAKTPEAAKEVLDKYVAFTKQSADFHEGSLTINDRYNGDIPMVWKGKYIVGLFQEEGNAVPGATEFLDELVKKLP